MRSGFDVTVAPESGATFFVRLQKSRCDRYEVELKAVLVTSEILQIFCRAVKSLWRAADSAALASEVASLHD